VAENLILSRYGSMIYDRYDISYRISYRDIVLAFPSLSKNCTPQIFWAPSGRLPGAPRLNKRYKHFRGPPITPKCIQGATCTPQLPILLPYGRPPSNHLICIMQPRIIYIPSWFLRVSIDTHFPPPGSKWLGHRFLTLATWRGRIFRPAPSSSLKYICFGYLELQSH
jgi:hypothetical protein